MSSFPVRLLRYFCFGLLFGGLVRPSTSMAQTFRGQPMLSSVPGSSALRAIVTARAQSPLLLIRYENQDNQPVRIQLQDGRGTCMYDELYYAPKYAGRFDLSSLPAGTYRLHLRTVTGHVEKLVQVALLGERYPIVSIQPDDRTIIAEATTHPATY